MTYQQTPYSSWLWESLLQTTPYIGDTTYWRTCPETLKSLPIVNGIVRLVYPTRIVRTKLEFGGYWIKGSKGFLLKGESNK